MVIRFENICKSYRNHFWSRSVKALNDLSFSVEEGNLIGFLGANGAGKTTSIKIIMKFIDQDYGSIHYNLPKPVFSQIGYLPERPYFYPHLTGREFLLYMGELGSVSRKDLKDRINYWMKRTNIFEALDRKILSYSKGMLQRLGFVAALLHDPQLLILDEPLAGLDPVGRKNMKDILVELHAQGKTIFFSSHIVSDVEQICNKVVVIEKGSLLYEGDIDKLIEDNVELKKHIRVEANEKLQLGDDAKPFSEKQIDGKWIVDYELQPQLSDGFIKEVLDSGGRIVEVSQNRPSLEQIVYKIR